MAKAQDAELLVDARAELGEGALWDARERVLYWVDITGEAVHVFDPASGKNTSHPVGQKVGTVVCRRSGGLMLAVHHGFARFGLDSRSLEIVADPESATPTNRFNDGKCDPAGRFWAGTMDLDGKKGAGALYRMDADGKVHRMLGGVSCSNGIVWSRDARTMYYIDTPTREVSAFDYDRATGSISNRRAAVRVPESLGLPDGMCIDAEDNLWVAMWGGSSVTRWDPATGTLVASYPLPASQVTSCAFGGEKLDELYVTTARVSLSAEALRKEPHAGGLFRLRPGARGVPAVEYAG